MTGTPDVDRVFLDYLSSRGKTRPFTLEGSEHLDETVIQPIADSVLAFVRGSVLDPALGELVRPDRVVVRTVPHAKVQAVTIWLAPVHAIAVNLGLMLFVYRVARAVAGQVIVRTEQDPPVPPEREAVDVVATLVDWLSSPVHAPLIDDWPAGPREVRTADNIARACERFVLCHEIAHILHGHLIADAGLADPAEVPLERLDQRGWQQEIEADVVGAALTMDSLPDSGVDPRAGAVGAVFFLRCLAMAESVGAITPGDTHPTAAERLAAVDSALRMRYGPHAPKMLAAADEYDVLLERVGAAALVVRDRRRTQARAVLDRAFREHPLIFGGDRDWDRDVALLEQVQTMLATAPSAVLEAVAANLMDTAEYERWWNAVGSQEQLRTDDRFRRHHLALFLGTYLPPPVKRALGINTIAFTTPQEPPS